MKMVKKNDLNSKLDLIIKNQKRILANEKRILKEENKITDLELQELKEEETNYTKEEVELNELVQLEKKLRKDNYDPIREITKKDMFKGFIGAFAGLIGHFAFAEGYHLGENINMLHATVLYIIAFIIINIMLYYTGFRNVRKKLLLRFMPMRATILYFISIFTIFFVYLIFGKISFPFDFVKTYSVISSSVILAVMGAGTADLIGKNHH